MSRILGYLRDILIAVFLGASIFADAFFVAFRLPNTFRRLFAEGTFNAAFIPSYTSHTIRSKNVAKSFADEVLTLLTIVLFFIVPLHAVKYSNTLRISCAATPNSSNKRPSSKH